MNIPFTEEQGKQLTEWVDDNHDGTIDYSELATKLLDDVNDPLVDSRYK